MDRLDTLLKELSILLDLSLHTDARGVSAFSVNDRLKVQIELDPGGEKVLVVCSICEIHPGKFRENVLREALKENNEPPPDKGIFAYLARTNSLILFEYLFLHEMTGLKMADFLAEFIEKGEAWYNAVLAGLPSPRPDATLNQDKPPQ